MRAMYSSIRRNCVGVTSDRYSGKACFELATPSAFSMSASSLSMWRHVTVNRRTWFELRDSSGMKLQPTHKGTRPAEHETGCSCSHDLRNLSELEDGGENSEINPYQENSFFFVGVICQSRAVKGELQHPIELCQPGEAKSIADNATTDAGRVMRQEKAFLKCRGKFCVWFDSYCPVLVMASILPKRKERW